MFNRVLNSSLLAGLVLLVTAPFCAVDEMTVAATTVVTGRPVSAQPGGDLSAPVSVDRENDRGSASPDFEVGAKIKLMFYEVVNDIEADKWAKPGYGMGFQHRPELSGEYTIQGDGTIALPMLGSFSIENQTTQSLQSSLAGAFEKLTGRKGFVTVLSLERPPIYVLGPVKTPGVYKYSPGMTIFHAIALAGGFDRVGSEPFQQVEYVRETVKRRYALEAIADLLARGVVLRAERDQVAIKMPVRLIELVGRVEAAKMVAAETDRRATVVAARANRERMLTASVETAKQELQMMTGKVHPFRDLIKLRTERANGMEILERSGTIGRLLVIQAQGELADTEQRRQDSINQLTLARQRVSQLEQEKAKLDSDTRGDLDNAIMTIEQQITGYEREIVASDGVLSVLNTIYRLPLAPVSGDARPVNAQPGSETPQFTYEIIRQTSTGPIVIAVASRAMTTLYPGDLVRIMTPGEAPTERRDRK